MKHGRGDSLRVVQVIHSVDNPSAGPTYTVARLAASLRDRGVDCTVSALGDVAPGWPKQVPVDRYSGVLERRVRTSPRQWQELRAIAARPVVLHGNGLWLPANFFPLFVPMSWPAQVVISPHGMMSSWAMRHRRWRKAPVWHALQKPALRRANGWHATSAGEAEDIRRVGLRQPIAVIPNGIDLPEMGAPVARAKQVVFLSRIDPKKGLDLLLPAWQRLAPRFEEWQLVIAGPLEGEYPRKVLRLAEDLRLPRVKFTGAVHGEDKWRLLRESSLFVLPSYSENFGMVVAEALAAGTPVLTTTETPWLDLAERGAGWCITPEQAPLEQALQHAMSLPLEELATRGERGRAWMRRDYAWDGLGAQMHEFYDWLLCGGSRPDCVRLD